MSPSAPDREEQEEHEEEEQYQEEEQGPVLAPVQVLMPDLVRLLAQYPRELVL